MSASDAPPTGKRPLAHIIQDALPPVANGRSKRRRGVGVFKKATSTARRDETIFRILCPASKTGSIIGKGGSIIKSIRKDTGTMIRVEEVVPGCEERVVTISAKEDRSKLAKLRAQHEQVKEGGEEESEQVKEGDEDENEQVNEAEQQEKADYLSDFDEEQEAQPESSTQVEAQPESSMQVDGRNEEDKAGKGGESDARGNEEGIEVKDELQSEVKEDTKENIKKEGDDQIVGESSIVATDAVMGQVGEKLLEIDDKQLEEEGSGACGEQESVKEEGKKEGTAAVLQEASLKEAELEAKEGGLSPVQEALLRVHLRILEADPPKPEEMDGKEGDLKICTRLLVPASQVGCLLGKKGKIIQQMREDSGAQIRVLSRDQLPRCAAPADEVVQIMGDPMAVRKALLAASSQLRTNPPKEPSQEFGSPYPAAGAVVEAKSAGYMGAHSNIGRPLSPPHALGQSTGHFAKEEVIFRILCPKEKIGSIIGKGGSIVQSLREETGARISIDVTSSEGDERVVRVSALENPEDPFSKAQNALMIVHGKIIANSDKDGPGTTKLLVPSDQAGCLIGKGGSIIIEMRKLTRAKIRIYGKEHLPPCALENDELVQIIGNASVLQDAVMQITSRLRANLFQGKFVSGHIDKKPFSATGPQSEGPSPLGMGMLTGVSSATRYHSPYPDIPSGFKGQSRGSLTSSWPSQGYVTKGFMDYPSDSMAVTGDISRSSIAHVASKTVQVVVPERVMGSIIGEKGGNLAQICEISGAKVKVHLSTPGASERIVEISGTLDQTHAAQSLLQAFILSGQ